MAQINVKQDSLKSYASIMETSIKNFWKFERKMKKIKI